MAIRRAQRLSTHLTLENRVLFGYRYVFPKPAVQKLAVRQRCILPAVPYASIKISHNLPDVPPYILFGTFDPDGLTRALTVAGFEFTTA